MARYAYLVEVKSIQNFLFAGEKLKDMINASEIVATITDEVFSAVVAQLEYTNLDFRFVRKAGGALYLTYDDRQVLIKLQQLFDLVCKQLLPTAQVISTVSQVKETDLQAVQQGLQNLTALKNRTNIDAPLATPITLRSQRTGKAGVAYKDGEVIDYQTQYKRSLPEEIKTKVTSRFANLEPQMWPKDLSHPVFSSAKVDKVAIIHADGNGLGIILRELNKACQTNPEVYVELYSTFSQELELATISAAQKATAEAIVPHQMENTLPARPLILGGDDITIITRADIAVSFTSQFIKHFEHETSKVMNKIKALLQRNGTEIELKNKLTACAGIVYLKANQPFSMGYKLAESACGFAKNASVAAKQETNDVTPSSVAFIDIQSSLTGSMDEMLQRERTVTLNNTSIALTPGVYGLEQDSPLPFNLTQLKQRTEQFDIDAQEHLSVGKIRRLLGELHEDQAVFDKSITRLAELDHKKKLNLHTIIEELKSLKQGVKSEFMWADIITCSKLNSFGQQNETKGSEHDAK